MLCHILQIYPKPEYLQNCLQSNENLINPELVEKEEDPNNSS